MRKYFIHNGETENGPFDIEQLKSMQIKSETPIWYEGLQNWTVAGNVEELKTTIISTSTPPKFENFTQQNSNVHPPSFRKTSFETNQNFEPKKSKTLRNVLIGVVVLAIVFIGLSIATNNSEPTYNENGEFIDVDSVATSAVDEERNRINEELTIKNRNYRNNFEKYIRVSTNQYTYNELGGISNLDVIVTNDTDYMLDEVNVNIDYIKDNGDIFKSEIVTLNNIPAHQNKSASAPESNRGTSVEVRMDGITSKKMHFCFYATNGIGTYSEPENANDPYFCK
jgi:hypothetical protein